MRKNATIRKKQSPHGRPWFCNIVKNTRILFKHSFVQGLVPVGTVFSEKNIFLYNGQSETRPRW